MIMMIRRCRMGWCIFSFLEIKNKLLQSLILFFSSLLLCQTTKI